MMGTTPKLRAHDYQVIDGHLKPITRALPDVTPEDWHTRQVKVNKGKQAEDYRERAEEFSPKPVASACAPKPKAEMVSVQVLESWGNVPPRFEPYVKALIVLRRRLFATRVTKHIAPGDNHPDAEFSDGGNFEHHVAACIARGYDVASYLDKREQVLRSWIDGTARMRPDTSPEHLQRVNEIAEQS